ncbi:MAG TPA: ribonuclease R [Phycisphaerae bacterium]|nr:ribonuclease R [Phycisphaerae bacterium]
MPERYVEGILKYLADRSYQPVKTHQLARQMGIAQEDYGTFREAIKRLRDSGRIVLGERQALTLPEPGKRIIGTYRANPRGFGFVVPEQPNAHGDLYIPREAAGSAMTGDRVVAKVTKRGKRGGEMVYSGLIVQILDRGNNRFVGVLQQTEGTWFVLPEGGGFTSPIVIKDIGAAGPKAGTKVVAEIVKYPAPGDLPTGVIVETLGPSGPLAVETLAVIRAYGLADEFPPDALANARAAVDAFDAKAIDGREDLTAQTVVTIDPPDARDFDDAIGLAHGRDGRVTLGVHIADVSNFVADGGPLDAEARRRGTSVYFPRKVLPMLPEILSNGVCSLQEGQNRYCKSILITYDADANVAASRLAETVIRSSKRLTYTQAQAIIDGREAGCDRKVAEVLREMDKLARRIEQRRLKAGMLQLDLPALELVFDDGDRAIDAVPADDSYTHRLIEMFMVEANEAVARVFDRVNRPILRRIHPEPDTASTKQLSTFVRAAGHKLPRNLGRHDMQKLLQSVKGKPESHAVNLAVLKTMERAEYSPMQIGHFALASDCYCHFTSPIRRYPDLTVHRMVAEHCRGRLETRPPEDLSELVKLGEACTAAEQRAEDAERELNEVLVLQLLATKVGECFDGVVTGVTNFGLFVELGRYGIDGLVRFADLGDDWWDVDARIGQIRGERTGRTYRIGDIMRVRIAEANVARRQLNLVPEHKQ